MQSLMRSLPDPNRVRKKDYLVIPLPVGAGALRPPSSLSTGVVAIYFGATLGLALWVGASRASTRHNLALTSPQSATSSASTTSSSSHASTPSWGWRGQGLASPIPRWVCIGLGLPVSSVRWGVHPAQSCHTGHLITFWALAAVVMFVHAGCAGWADAEMSGVALGLCCLLRSHAARCDRLTEH